MLDLKKGDCFYQSKDPRKYHVVEKIIEADDIIYVVKYFGIHKRWWHYIIMRHELIKLLYNDRLLGENRTDIR